MPTRHYDGFFINGQWQTPNGDQLVEVYSPATAQVIGRVPAANRTDIDGAVDAADRAAQQWAALDPQERGEVLGRIGKILRSRSDELAQLICDEVGSPKAWAAAAQVGSASGVFGIHRRLAASYPWVESRPAITGGQVRIRRVPVGVVAAIVPWNAPLFTAALKVAPALLAGCPVVLKPSLEAPLSAFALAEAAAEAGLPDGVLNVVPADIDASEYLIGHPNVAKVSFTGSTVVGRRIAEVCGHDLRRVTLELGGKSAAIITPELELTDDVVAQIVSGAMAGSGQVCTALSRILVPRSRYPEIVDRLAHAVAALRVGDPSDPETQMGPVISEQARTRIEGVIDTARRTARVVTGGGRPDHLPVGHYVRPALIADVDPEDSLARDEIFGPVAVAIAYADDDDAVRIANGTQYGLAASVWTADVEHGEQLAARLVAGSVAVNSSAPLDLGSPFGGMKASGIGREGGPEGITDFVEHQTIILPGA